MSAWLVQVDTGYACFGLVILDDVVRDAAPIARWTIGRPAKDVVGYYRTRKHATIHTQRISPPAPEEG